MMADQIVRWAADTPPAQKLELRAAAAGSDSPGTIAGPVVVYSDVATLPGGVRESINPGAFGDVSKVDAIAHYFHDRSQPLGRTNGGGLTLLDSPEMLWAELELPNTQRGRDAATEVRAGILQGYSSEFLPGRKQTTGMNVRIMDGVLRGVGLVDIPAYRRSQVSVRADGDT